MIPLTRSLNTKLLLIAMSFVMLSGILGAAWVGYAESQRIQAFYKNRLRALSVRYSHYVQDKMQSRVDALKAARAVLLKDLHSQGPTDFSLAEYRDSDGSYRHLQPTSGLFLRGDQAVTPAINRQAVATDKTWQHLVPVFKPLFNAFYFISPHQLSRVWPASFTKKVDAKVDFTQEIFYRVATPEQDPSRQPRWTDIYFDSYGQQWMTSLILPVYEGDKFLGVIGGDVPISYLLSNLQYLDDDNDAIKAFIYDQANNLIMSSDSLKKGQPRAAVKPQKTADTREKNTGIKQYIKAVTDKDLPLSVIQQHSLQQQRVNIISSQLNGMNWYVSFFYPQSVVKQRFRQSMESVSINIVFLAAFLFVVLFFSLRYFVIRRIAALVRATEKINHQNWQVSVPDKGSDEISRLGTSINTMLRQLRKLVSGLDDKIILLNKASAESRKLMSAIENSASLVAIVDKNWRLNYANSQYWQVTGFNQEASYQYYQPLMLTADNEQGISLKSIEDEIQASDKHGSDIEDAGRWQAEYQATTAKGSTFWIMQTITAINDNKGDAEFYVCVGQDISDLKQKQRQVEKLAYYDHLTGLANRTEFKNQLHRGLVRNFRNHTQLALFYLDLDHFKRINDTFGHESGDQLLMEVSGRLCSCLREGDIVARLGGDEFAIMLEQIESPQYAFVVANKIIQALNEPVELEGKEVIPGVSIGITMAPNDSEDIDTLMKNADLAMYQAKDKGRNVFQFYTADMNFAVEQRLTIEREMRIALKQGQFELYYQPLIDLSSGEIVAAEALVRWNHPVKGLVSPAEFIPAAEDSGLIIPLGKWVLKTACYQARTIQKAIQKDFRISVNLSARQLNDTGFIRSLTSILQESTLAPASLELEVTESMLMVDADNVIARLEQMRSMGCGLAIDDFGTGYSSLSYLKRLPINSLKIDHSFVRDLPDDEEDRAITSLIVAMAESLRYKVVVEGVETQAQHEFLTHCGCHLGQGFLYSRPVPADDFLALLHKKQPQ